MENKFKINVTQRLTFPKKEPYGVEAVTDYIESKKVMRMEKGGGGGRDSRDGGGRDRPRPY